MLTTKLAYLVTVAVLCAPAALSAQCEQPQSSILQCQAVGCVQSVQVVYPMSSEYGLILSAGFVSC